MTRNRKRKYTRRNKRKGGWGFPIISQSYINKQNDIGFEKRKKEEEEKEKDFIYTENPLYVNNEPTDISTFELKRQKQREYDKDIKQWTNTVLQNGKIYCKFVVNDIISEHAIEFLPIKFTLIDEKEIADEELKKNIILYGKYKQWRNNGDICVILYDGKEYNIVCKSLDKIYNVNTDGTIDVSNGGKTKRRRTRRINAKRLSAVK